MLIKDLTLFTLQIAFKYEKKSVNIILFQGKLLKPHIAKLVVALLESLSGLEPQVWSW